MSRLAAIFLFGLTAATMVSSAAPCDDGLKLAVGAPNNWDSVFGGPAWTRLPLGF